MCLFRAFFGCIEYLCKKVESISPEVSSKDNAQRQELCQHIRQVKDLHAEVVEGQVLHALDWPDVQLLRPLENSLENAWLLGPVAARLHQVEILIGLDRLQLVDLLLFVADLLMIIIIIIIYFKFTPRR